MARFYPLTVVDVRPETRAAVAVTLTPRPEDAEHFRFVQGQYLTFRHRFDGEEVRRCYSICTTPGSGVLRVGIKKVEGGWFSTFANEVLKPGDVLEAMPPMGSFHAPLEPASARSYVLFAAGSGITPILGILETVLAAEPRARISLVYGNHSSASIMFRSELDDLKDTHLDRLAILHVLGTEADIPLFQGRIDRAKCDALFDRWVDVGGADLAFVCGPEPMMLEVRASLRAHGMADDRIKLERFASSVATEPRPRRTVTAPAMAATVTYRLDGVSRTVALPKDGKSLLEAALAADLDAPHACKAGVCSTCRARLVEGEVTMDANYALDDDEIRRGYILTCQSHPLTDRLVVDYDG